MTKGAEAVRKTSTELTSLSTTVTTILGITDLALRRGGGHFAQVFLVFRVGGVLCQLVEDVGARRVCDVKVMSERRAIRGRTGEGMLFVGLILKETRQKKIFDPYKGISLYTLLDKKKQQLCIQLLQLLHFIAAITVLTITVTHIKTGII